LLILLLRNFTPNLRKGIKNRVDVSQRCAMGTDRYAQRGSFADPGRHYEGDAASLNLIRDALIQAIQPGIYSLSILR